MLSKNQQKFIQSLKLKKFRQKYGQFTAEGEKTLRELLKSRYRIQTLFATQEWIEKNAPEATGFELVKVTEEELSRISNHQSPQQVLALVNMPEDVKVPTQAEGLCLALDNIQDPGNLGTIVRIADWYGIKHIVCSEECAELYNPKVISSTMGSIARVEVSYTKLENWLKALNSDIYATTLDGENVHTIKADDDAIIMVGNEGKGLRPELIKLANRKISIPLYGGAESLNAAVATAIICDNFRRQSE